MSFVLKIAIGNKDGDSVEWTRVKFSRINYGLGNVSFEMLVKIVQEKLAFEHDRDPNDFRVAFTYQDDQDDTISVMSAEELLDAIDQYADKKSLCFQAKYKIKNVNKKGKGNDIRTVQTLDKDDEFHPHRNHFGGFDGGDY